MQLPSDYIGKSNKKSDLRAIRLQELGPRLELRLVKIVGGMMGDGDVIFHEFGKSKKKQMLESADG